MIHAYYAKRTNNVSVGTMVVQEGILGIGLRGMIKAKSRILANKKLFHIQKTGNLGPSREKA